MIENTHLKAHKLKNACYDNFADSKESAMLFDNFIWRIDEVCRFTKYAKGTIYNLVSKGEIPYRRGRKRKLIFISTEIIDWLKGD
jgi:predicted DNA-binding transcriptional regulator AlpA